MTPEERWDALERRIMDRANRCGKLMADAADSAQYRDADQFKRAAIVYRACLNMMREMDGRKPVDTLDGDNQT